MKTVMLVLVTAFCATLNAATVDLISSGGGVFDYGLMLTPGESVTFGATDQITFSGASDVTGASANGSLASFFESCGTTSSSACFDNVLHAPEIISNGGGGAPLTLGTFSLFSTATTTGLINFSVQTDTGIITGQVTGPVAATTTATPEPNTLGMIALAGIAFSFVGLYRRKRLS